MVVWVTKYGNTKTPTGYLSHMSNNHYKWHYGPFHPVQFATTSEV
jgi:hypothetical protein